MSNRFDGSYRGAAVKMRSGGPRGIARMDREMKRQEAKARNAATPHIRTRRHRLGKCSEAEHMIQEVFSA